jgi:hypothetical protein
MAIAATASPNPRPLGLGQEIAGLAGIVDERLVAGRMLLPRHRRQAPLEAAEPLAERL